MAKKIELCRKKSVLATTKFLINTVSKNSLLKKGYDLRS
jgi:hypothetical protein